MVRSPLPLGGPVVEGTADVTVTMSEPAEVPLERASAEVVAERRDGPVVYFSVCRVPGGVSARFYGLGEFVVSDALDEVRCWCTPGTDPEYLSILLGGSVAAYLHMAHGRAVLHASAVALRRGCVAFAGPSEGGKTTTAALLCAEGAALVTDDVLVVDLPPDGSVVARRGTNELRARPGAGSIVERIDAVAALRATVDRRTAVRVAMTSRARQPLSAIAFPRPMPGVDEVSARRCTPAEASMLLGSSQRIEGWQERAGLLAQFQSSADVAGRVPVVVLTLPWGPPYRASLAADIVDACNAATGPSEELIL